MWRSSPQEPERTSLMMNFTISKTHSHLCSWTWDLVLPYLLLLFILLALSDRALGFKTTCLLVVSLFEENCLIYALNYTQRYLSVVLVNLLNLKHACTKVGVYLTPFLV